MSTNLTIPIPGSNLVDSNDDDDFNSFIAGKLGGGWQASISRESRYPR